MDKLNNLSDENDENILLKKLSEILSNENLSIEEKENLILKIHQISIKQSTFKGPLPPPNILEDYNKLINDGAERIFK